MELRDRDTKLRSDNKAHALVLVFLRNKMCNDDIRLGDRSPARVQLL